MLTVRVDDDLYRQIDELAAELGLDRSEVVRNALTAGVAEGKLHSRRLHSPAIRTLLRALLAIDGDGEQLALFDEAIGRLGTFPDGSRQVQ